MAAAPTFRKRERMVSNLLIEALFENGSSVPKKRFKHAVDRNRVKRQIREAYRQHKQLLWEGMAENQEMLVGFIWLSDRHYPTKEVESRVVKILEKVKK